MGGTQCWREGALRGRVIMVLSKQHFYVQPASHNICRSVINSKQLEVTAKIFCGIYCCFKVIIFHFIWIFPNALFNIFKRR